MLKKSVIQKALNETWELDNNPGLTGDIPAPDQSSVISRLIYDIYGGEILKSRNKKGWYFYNRINGANLDFTGSETNITAEAKRLEDIPSTPEETYNYFDREDYSTFFMRFIRAFEETVGLEKCQPDIL